MGKKRLLWQLYPSYLFITLIALVAVAWYASSSLRDFYLKEAVADLEARAELVEKHILHQLKTGGGESVDSLCKELGKKAATRLTVVLSSGKVIGDSHEDPANMENHADRDEIRDALGGQVGASKRFSKTRQRNMLYVALPLRGNGEIIGVVRTSIPLTSIDQALRAIQMKILLGGLIVAISAAAISLLISRQISRPLERMREGAERFARGDLESRLPIPDTEELAGLAEAMNQMAYELDSRIRAATQQRNEMEAVLSSMVEGVLAVNTEERIIGINHAAGELLGVNPDDARGRTMQEAVRNVELQHLVAGALQSIFPVEGDITLRDGGEKFLQVHGTILHDPEGRGIGALIVLNDVTRIRRLEDVRREFVGNVVHELRTPVTSIKGFVETLLDDKSHDRSDTEHFLSIIARQTDRLNAIIEDLLSLSRIEQEAENAEITLKGERIVDVLQSAIQLCQAEAAVRKTKIDLVCEEDLVAQINAPLLEQAVSNLIDNAIKYSEPGNTVHVTASREDGKITIAVHDNGCGIPQEHLPRIFERFYRVDKARSRKLGGTGLGLAIVKHITQAHGGHVSVESILGKGSTFQIHIPSPG